MDQLLPEQQNQLKIWAEQRDSALAEIAVAKKELESLTKLNISLAESNTDLQQRANKLVVSIGDMMKEEAELKRTMNVNQINQAQLRSKLEYDYISAEKQVKLLIAQKDLLTENIITLTDVHDKVFKRVGVLDKVVDHVVRISDKNMATLDSFISNLKNK